MRKHTCEAAVDGFDRCVSPEFLEAGQSSSLIEPIEERAFRFRTLEDACALANAFATLCAHPASAGVGLAELLINAVEHGNLGIGLHEKAALLRAGRWEQEVARRLWLPENVSKIASLRCWREWDCLVFSVVDQGRGFEWRRFLVLDQGRASQPNGRGIALARSMAFRALEYRGGGNEALASVPMLSPGTRRRCGKRGRPRAWSP